MHRNLSILAIIAAVIALWGGLLVALEQPPTSGQQTDSDRPDASTLETADAEATLTAAIEALESLQSVRATFRYRVDLFGKELVGSGSYEELQPGRNRRMRIEMKIQMGTDTSTLLQVYDGRYLWKYLNLRQEGSLTRVDMARVARMLERNDTLPELGQIEGWTGLGGMPKLLRGLRESFSFSSATRGVLQDKTVWQLRGRWKPEHLASLLPEQAPAIRRGGDISLDKLPHHVPTEVIVYLGDTDLFPHRIEYLRAAPDGYGELKPIVTMEWQEAFLDVPLDRSRFTYNPGNLDYSDTTEAFMNSLRRRSR